MKSVSKPAAAGKAPRVRSKASISKGLLLSGAALLALAVAAGPVRAETLEQALAAAYATNPLLNAERASLRATDENVPRAKSGFRPRVTAGADTTWRTTVTRRAPPDPSTLAPGAAPPDLVTRETVSPYGYSVVLNQNIFAGFQNLNAVREAEAAVSAGREVLRGVEQGILLDVVAVYVDVLRDQAIVRLREGNIRVLSEQLRATQDRFEVGEVTRTDVAQAQAARAAAISALNLAQANLKASRANYQRLVGHPPAGLHQPAPMERLVPHSLDEALYVADTENPNILAAVFAEAAAGHNLKRIMGELLPTVSLEASYTDRRGPSPTIDRTETTTVVGRVNVPLYQGGEVAARVRQAKDINLQRRRELDQARTQIQADVVANWGRLEAARALIVSDQAQVEASRIALSGVREEENVGQRTVLDVLDAQQSLLDAEVALVTTRRDLVVASYAIVASVGRMDVVSLGLPVEVYDPTDHYRRVKNKWWGLNAEPLPLLLDAEPRPHPVESWKR